MGEESLLWSNTLEEVSLQVNFDNVSSLGSEVGDGVVSSNAAAGECSLDGVEKNLVVLDLLLLEITVPGSNSVIVDGNTLGVSVVEEFDFVGNIITHGVSDKCFAALDLQIKIKFESSLIINNLHPR